MDREASVVDEFRWDQDAQNRREQAFSGGNKTERDSYYGYDKEGDAKERRLNFKDYLIHRKGPEEVRAPWEEEYHLGHELGVDHGEDFDHADTDALGREMGRSPHPEHFYRGYSHGLDNAVPRQRIAVLVGDGVRVIAHVSGNQIDILHCPFCGTGSVIGRSDGTVECGYCTAVFTVQVQPQYNGFPQSVDGQPYQWPGMPSPPGNPVDPNDPNAMVGDGGEGMASPDMPDGTNLNPNTNGSGFDSSDPADGGGDEDDDDDDDDKPAFLKGKGDSKSKDKKKGDNPFAKKKSSKNPWEATCKNCGKELIDTGKKWIDEGGSTVCKNHPSGEKSYYHKPVTGARIYRTATGAVLDEDNYLAHLAIAFAEDKAKMASLVKASRRG